MKYGSSKNVNLRKIKHSKHLLNVRNTDDFCVLYAIASGLFLNDKTIRDRSDPTETLYTNFIKSLNLQDVSFPGSLCDIKTLVNNNKSLDLTINIFSLIQNDVYSILQIGRGNVIINLLTIDLEASDFDKFNHKFTIGHVVLIKDLGKYNTIIEISYLYL